MLLEKLHIGYNNHSIAHIASSDILIEPGSITTIIGANGSGKSTLLKTLNSSLSPVKGLVQIDNNNLHYKNDLNISKTLATVLTSQQFNGGLKVIEVLELSRAPYTNSWGTLTYKDEDIINQTIALFDLKDLINEPLDKISDGQRQRVFIARAIVQDTPYIFMDEPTSFLDIHHKTALLHSLKSYCKKYRKALVFSSHDIQLALHYCDYVISIHNAIISHNSKEQFIASNQLQQLFPSPYVDYGDGVIKFKQ